MPRSPFRGVEGLKGAAAQQYHGRFDFAAIGACVDLIAPMDYDLTGSAPDGKAAAANSPLAIVAESVSEWTELGLPADKLLPLLPWYGYDMACRPGQQKTCEVQLPWAENNHEVGFGFAWRMSKAAAVHGRDDDGSPWCDYQNATGWRRRIYYDDEVSIARKVQMVARHGVAGVGTWTTDTLESLHSVAAAAPEVSSMWTALWPRPAAALKSDEPGDSYSP